MHYSLPRFKLKGLWSVGAAVFGVICVFLLVLHGGSSITKTSSLEFGYPSPSIWLKSSANDYHDVYNETLGVCAAIAKLSDYLTYMIKFQEIFLVSLPERSDRRDSFAVQARLSNMSFTVVDGVDGTTVSKKALPFTMDQPTAYVGSWRAHMNVMEHMVANKIATALIFEDDADWDVGIKAQMGELARGTRWLGNASEEAGKPKSPFGDEWDFIFVGHCSIKTGFDPRRWVVPHDPTVIPPEHRNYIDKPDMQSWETGPHADNQTRIIFAASWGYCTTTYAVTLRGAMKILNRQSLSRFNLPFDMGLAHMCANTIAANDIKCIGVHPSITGLTRPPGNPTKFSDIEAERFDSVQLSEKSHSEGLVFSVHQNIDRLLAGQAEFQSEFPEITGETMHFNEISAATGHGEWIDSVETQ